MVVTNPAPPKKEQSNSNTKPVEKVKTPVEKPAAPSSYKAPTKYEVTKDSTFTVKFGLLE